MALPIVVVHYRAPDWLVETVESFLTSDILVEMLVVHNGGELPQLPSSVEVVNPGRNLGYAGGANLGLGRWLDLEDSPFCVVASHDVRVQADTLRRLVEAAKKNVRFGALAPNLARYKVSGGLVERVGLNGTCLLLRRECIASIGLFDEEYGSYGEDKDLSMRMLAGGWALGVVGDALAQDHGTSMPRIAGPLMYANRVLLAAKHRGKWPMLKQFFSLIPLALRDFGRAIIHPDNRQVHLHRGRSRILAVPMALIRVVRFYARPIDRRSVH